MDWFHVSEEEEEEGVEGYDSSVSSAVSQAGKAEELSRQLAHGMDWVG
jgi:hypothetical protein